MSQVTLIEKLKVKALITAPFFASLLLRRPLLEDMSCPTAWTDGEQIGYNPDFLNRLSFAEALSVLCHEILHIAFLHHVRIGDRDPKRWNAAADYAINSILVEAGFKLPVGGLLDPRFKGMGAEQIYALLPEDFSSNPTVFLGTPNKDGSTCGPAQDSGITPVLMGEIQKKNFGSSKERDLYINELKGQVAEAMQTAKMRGLLPGSLTSLVTLLDKATVDWKETLASFLTERIQTAADFNRPNRRWLSSDIYLPSRSSVERGKFVLAVDVSGSISTHQLKRYSSEILSILSMSSDTLLVLFFDTRVTKEIELEEGHVEDIKIPSGGGTDYKPVMEYLDAHGIQPEALIILTDGECNSFATEPDYPVLWTVDGLEFTPPYGEVIVLPHAA